jgi:hypothetical protein
VLFPAAVTSVRSRYAVHALSWLEWWPAPTGERQCAFAEIQNLAQIGVPASEDPTVKRDAATPQ